MKAVVLKRTGPAEELTKNLTIEEIPIPEIKEDEILIQIKAASLNHRDLWIAKGKYSKINLPVIPGSDCSGFVYSAGKNVKNFKEGDEVIVNPGFNWGSNEEYQSREFSILGMPENGTFAEFVKVKSEYVYPKPGHLDFLEASVFPLAGVTSYRGLFRKACLKKNEKILITGIGGGVATMSLVFALAAGVEVYVTSSDAVKIKKAIELGAEFGVNYNDPEWRELLKEKTRNNIDIILDSAGGADYSAYADLCSYGGRIVTYGAVTGFTDNINLHKLYWKQLKILGTAMGSQKDFEDMLNFINEFKIMPVTDCEYGLNGIHEAFMKMNASAQFGKIIIIP